jgi:uncharacterized phage protein gp47/JayE
MSTPTIQLTDAGLQISNQAEIAEAMALALKTATKSDGVTLAFGPNWLTDPDSVDGLFLHNLAEGLADVHEAVSDVYNSIGPAAYGKTLDNVMVLAGLLRDGDSRSKVTVHATADAGGCTVPALTVIKTVDTGAQFVTLANKVIAPNATESIDCQALQAGPVAAAADTLAVLVTPVSGLASVTNPDAASVGHNVELDTALRQRHLQSLANQGLRTLDAIRAAVLKVSGVTDCKVYENTGLTPDGGIPGKAIAVVAVGGTDVEVATAIFRTKAESVEAFGVSHETIGGESVGFTRPSNVNIYYVVTMTPAASSAERAAAKAALAAFLASLSSGDPVIQFKALGTLATIFGAKSQLDVTQGILPDLSDQADTTITINPSGRAYTQASFITVT